MLLHDELVWEEGELGAGRAAAATAAAAADETTPLVHPLVLGLLRKRHGLYDVIYRVATRASL